MTINHFGWAVHLGHCKYLDSPGKVVLSVNLVRPGASDQKRDWYTDHAGAGIPAEEAIDKLGNLVFPWRWQSVEWTLFGRMKNSAWEKLGTYLRSPEAVQVSKPEPKMLWAWFEEEIARKTNGCPAAFSIERDHAGHRPGNPPSIAPQSLPHALAPFAHLPAPISNGVLGLDGFLVVQEEAFGKYEIFACFPNFDCQFENGMATKFRVTGTVSQAPGARPGMVYSADPKPAFETVFFCNELLREGFRLAASESTASVGEGEDRRAVQVAAAGLAPLRLLHSYVSAAGDGLTLKPGDFDAWRKALIRGIGWGWERTRRRRDLGSGDQSARDTPIHILEIFASERDLQRYFGASWRDGMADRLRQADAALDPVVFLKKLKDDVVDWPTLATALGHLLGADGSAFIQAWRMVAGAATGSTEATHLYALWWRCVLKDLPLEDASAAPDYAKTLESYAKTLESLRGAVSDDLIRRAKLALLAEPRGIALTADEQAILNKVADGERPRPSGQLVAPLAKAAAFDVIPHGTKEFERAVQAGIDLFERTLVANAKPDAPQPHDAGVLLTFDMPGGATEADQEMRGYAIALRSGLKPEQGAVKWDAGRARWITDTAVTAKPMSDKYLEGSAKPLWMHETVGSTVQDGLRTVQLDYRGHPLSSIPFLGEVPAIPAEEDFDQTDLLDYRWPLEKKKLPLLGYGQHYQMVTTAIDNAGAIVDEALRATPWTVLKDPGQVDFGPLAGGASPYLSRTPPGAPRLVVAPDAASYELSGETRAHVFQEATTPVADGNIMPVALLRSGEQVDRVALFSGGSGVLNFTVSTPASSAEFAERWLDTDVLNREFATAPSPVEPWNDRLSDEAFAGVSAAEVSAFRDRVSKSLRGSRDTESSASRYHPAVSAIGVAVWFDDPARPDGLDSTPHAHTFPIGRIADGKTLDLADPRKFEIELHAEWVSGRNNSFETAKRTIRIASGRFARIRVYTLVEERFFAANGAVQPRFGDIPRADQAGWFRGYRGFGPLELWFEATPSWETFKEGYASDFVTLGIQTASLLDPNRITLKATSQVPVDWLRGLFIQRHDWHWTGYPVRLPDGTELDEWLSSFTGVESYRESRQIGFQTGLSTSGWWLGKKASNTDIVDVHPLAVGTRPARYAAYVARPVVRFRKWLNAAVSSGGPLGLEAAVFACGAVVPGFGPARPDERLPVPPLRWTIPLTAAYEPSTTEEDDLPARAVNGNLLVFDDALRRTDRLARLGGLGDTLEVDLLDTRMPKYPEIGPNPIFHGPPKDEDLAELALDSGEPFGLTHDIVSNAEVAQTAVVVVPRKAQGKWMMAKIRARRLILPETLLDSGLPEDGVLPLRREGEELVPMDFCVDLGSGQLPASIDLDKKRVVDLALLTKRDATRLLCSFHKGRWKSGEEPTWRLQVLAQKRKKTDAQGDAMAWETVDRISCYQTEKLPQFAKAPKLGCGSGRASLVRMSDYTAPTWLVFIGAFGQEKIGRADEYVLRLGTDGKTLQLQPVPRANPKAEIPAMPALKPRPAEATWNGEDVTFQMLFVFRPLEDIGRNAPDVSAGYLEGLYAATGTGGEFVPLGGVDAKPGKSYAYLCSLQRTTATSKKEIEEVVNGLGSQDELIKLLFPEQKEGNPGTRESLVRILPEHLGPIRIEYSPSEKERR